MPLLYFNLDNLSPATTKQDAMTAAQKLIPKENDRATAKQVFAEVMWISL